MNEISCGTILVMDDDEEIRFLAELILSRAGYRVKTCIDGNDAIALYQSAKDTGEPFTVSIMDLTIRGGMGGVEAARRILDIDPDAILIVSSGYSDDPVMVNFREYGFSAAIEKPYKVEDVTSAISLAREHGVR